MAEATIDDRVIAACQRGDREAFRELFEAYKDKVFSIAVYSLGGDQAAASDVSQQIFLKLINSIRQFRGDSAFTTWLYRLVVNACIDEQRKRGRLIQLADAPITGQEERRPQERHFARLEVSEQVQNAINELTPKLRMPILLKYGEGLSYEEIAEVLECSMGTVSSRLNRGHQSLAKKLSHLRAEV
ncbi:MAG TPA: sigma-70 family RNA polymerase sigma factor [Pyrinomonadaceae bacterium]|nr:sigma-70 family RNA polymerase sigma factor [Pyrinomonadaceae bacterium]